MNMLFRSDIQILRGFSVVIVFLYHLQIPGFENGYLGVDIFFVLSGYLMTQLYNQGSAFDFYKRRLKRLLPAYFVTIAITTFIVAFIAVPSDANQRFDRVWFDIIGMSNIAFWSENSYFDSAAFKPLLNLWSLGVELQYYLLVPLVLPFIHKRRWALFFMVLGSMIAAFILTTISPKTSFFMMPFRVWEFLFGATVAWHFSNITDTRRTLLLSILLPAILIAIIFVYPVKEDNLTILYGHPGIASFLITLFSSLILLKPLHTIFSNSNLFGKLFCKIGDYSYSIYLTHFPIIVLVNYKIFEGTILGSSDIGTITLIVILTFFSSFFLFNYIEKIRSNKNFAKLFFYILLVSLLIFLISPSINKYRFTDKQNLIFDAWTDKDIYRCGKLMRISSPTETVCKISIAENPKKVFLVGNSHADSVKKAFSNSMEQSDISSYFYVANNPLMTPQTSSFYIIADVKRLNISHVAVHFSPEFYTGKTYTDELKKFINDLQEAAIPFSLISPVPTYNFNVPKALYEDTLKTQEYIQQLQSAQPKELNSFFFDFLKDSQIPADRVFLTYDSLCDDLDRCMLIENGKPLYYDKDHLSLTGANKLLSLFDKIAVNINEDNN